MKWSAWIIAGLLIITPAILLGQEKNPLPLEQSGAAFDLAQGNAAFEKGDYDKAIADFNLAIQLNPNFAEVYYARGCAYQAKSQYDKAIADYDWAIQLDPDKAEAYRNRGNSHSAKGDYGQALSDFDKAIQLEPMSSLGFNDRAWLFATCPQSRFRNGKKALANAMKACEMSAWKNSGEIDTLAAAYAEIGDFNSAVKWESKYLETPHLTASESATDIADAKSRLALYQAHKPYHEDKKSP